MIPILTALGEKLFVDRSASLLQEKYLGRARPHCRFRSRDTGPPSEYGMQWMNGSAK
jgi:hypothetical protein